MNRNEVRKIEFTKIYDEAHAAGMAAGTGARPNPMIVGTPTSLFSDDIDLNKPVYCVPDGPCGFAEVIVKPATQSFARWLKKEKGCRLNYYGGMTIWVSHFGQSMARKEAYASAFADVLNKNGIKARMSSRMD